MTSSIELYRDVPPDCPARQQYLQARPLSTLNIAKALIYDPISLSVLHLEHYQKLGKFALVFELIHQLTFALGLSFVPSVPSPSLRFPRSSVGSDLAPLILFRIDPRETVLVCMSSDEVSECDLVQGKKRYVNHFATV